MSDLIAWFRKRREHEALKMMQNHLALVVTAVENLERAVNAASEGNAGEMVQSIKRVEEAEIEADDVRRKLMIELARGELPPESREDLMHLVKRIDMVADWSREAGRILEIIPIGRVPSKLWEACKALSHGTVQCAASLRKCINRLIENPEEALKAADDVERLEEKVDELYAKARETFVSESFEETTVAILFRDLMDAVEMVADWCENSCDQARVIAVRR